MPLPLEAVSKRVYKVGYIYILDKLPVLAFVSGNTTNTITFRGGFKAPLKGWVQKKKIVFLLKAKPPVATVVSSTATNTTKVDLEKKKGVFSKTISISDTYRNTANT